MDIATYQEMFTDESMIVELIVKGMTPIDVTGWLTEHAHRYNADKMAQLNGYDPLAADDRLVAVRAITADGKDFLVCGDECNGYHVRPFTDVMPACLFESGWNDTWDMKVVKMQVAATDTDGNEHLKVISVRLQKAY